MKPIGKSPNRKGYNSFTGKLGADRFTTQGKEGSMMRAKEKNSIIKDAKKFNNIVTQTRIRLGLE